MQILYNSNSNNLTRIDKRYIIIKTKDDFVKNHKKAYKKFCKTIKEVMICICISKILCYNYISAINIEGFIWATS